MTTFIYIVVVAIVLFGAALHAASKDAVVSLDLLVEAIRQVENTPRGFVGRRGERSEWQFKYATWAQYSTKPFEWASSSRVEAMREQRRVANEHAIWIIKSLPALGCPVNAYSVGLMWCAGHGAVSSEEVSNAQHDYAERVHNVYHELLKASAGKR